MIYIIIKIKVLVTSSCMNFFCLLQTDIYFTIYDIYDKKIKILVTFSRMELFLFVNFYKKINKISTETF